MACTTRAASTIPNPSRLSGPAAWLAVERTASTTWLTVAPEEDLGRVQHTYPSVDARRDGGAAPV